LVVFEELGVNKSTVGVYFIEFSIETVITREEGANEPKISLPSDNLLLGRTTSLGFLFLSSLAHFCS
jgi:hypothetical protein